jgi:protein-tyrosine phosphatase
MASGEAAAFGRRVASAVMGRWAAAMARLEHRLGPLPAFPRPVHRILVLCEGNLCRSPFAEELLRSRLVSSRIQVESAGLRAASGSPSPPLAVAAAAERGISLKGHRSRPLTAAMVDGADWILVMDLDHRRRLLAAHRQAAGKVELLARYDPDRSASPEIVDPMFGGADLYGRVYARIEAAVDGLADALSASGGLPRREVASRR